MSKCHIVGNHMSRRNYFPPTQIRRNLKRLIKKKNKTFINKREVNRLGECDSEETSSHGYKTFFMLNSTEHELSIMCTHKK